MRHLIKHKDGTVGIMTTTSEDINPENEFAKWTQENRDKIESHRPIDASEIVQDRYFRNALIHRNDKIEFDIDKCKDIHKNVLRRIRAPLLVSLDVEFTKANEVQDSIKMKEVIEKKNALRDVTIHPELLNATTPEQIKNFMPEILK